MNMFLHSNFFKVIAVFLSLMIFQSGFEIQALERNYQEELKVLVAKYNKKEYSEVISELEKLLNEISDEHSQIRGKLFLLLGAAYEKTTDKDNAVENYLLGDMLLDDLAIEGVDFSNLEIFSSTLYGKVINGRRVFEKVGKRKRRRKFPFLAVIGVIGIVAAVVILMKKKSGTEVDLKGKYANEVFNSIEWIDVPAGEFKMGDDRGLGSRDELPVHKVYLDSYKISKYEITVNQFKRFLDVHPEIIIGYTRPSGSEPVRDVTRENVEIFTRWITKYVNGKIDLPTEAQWEKAARGTDQRIYPWGNNPPNCSILNYNRCVIWPTNIGQYPGDISYYGVMDMGGNISEMVKDIYQENYYKISPYENPTGPVPRTSYKYVIRGANSSSSDPRASNREYMKNEEKDYRIGFRIVWNE